VITQCESERIKFQSLGWAILITSGMATVSMWFALYSAMGVNAIIAAPFALLWGLVIMGIDRWLITSMPADGRRRFYMAAPRLLLAILLGTLISTPLVLRIFQSEINAQISVMKANAASQFLQSEQGNQVGAQVTYWRDDVANLEKVIDTGGVASIDPADDPTVKSLEAQATTVYNQEQTYYKQWQCQLYGGPGCPPGAGTLYTASHANWEAAKTQLAQIDTQIQQREAALSASGAASVQSRLTQAKNALPGAQQQLSVAVARQTALQASFDTTNENENGLLIRLQALSQLSGKSFTVTAARFLLFLLFLVIECLPVTVKLLQQSGNYESILKVLQERELNEAKQYLRARRQVSSGTEPTAGRRQGSSTDDDVLRIWEERADYQTKERTKVMPDEGLADVEPDVYPGRRPQAGAEPGPRSTDEQPSAAHFDLQHMRDERVSANSDGNSGGIPLNWNDEP
jgi:multidrug efflux pump subunit AcrA (membrane-fusion protein)